MLNVPSSVPSHAEPPMQRCCRRPWDVYVEPFKMAPSVWFIGGNDWVACYLIETTEGLILIDTAMHETLYLLLENIHKIGHDPKDIKKILITHAHIDHIGGARALKELTGAELYLGERDMEFLAHPELLNRGGWDVTWGVVQPDHFYDDDTPVVLGNISIRTIATPGHTPGCTSMLFNVVDKDGRVLTCGLHGGLGVNTLDDEYFETTGQPKTLRDEYIAGLKKLDELHVDICLPSHTNQVDILPLAPEVTEDHNPFLDENIWHELMAKRLGIVYDLIK